MHLKALKSDHQGWHDLSDLFLMGRDPTCNIVVNAEGVEPRHLRIEKKTNGYIIRDLRSQNGSFVNSVRVLKLLSLTGDIISIGGEEFVFSNGDLRTGCCLQK